MRWVFENQLTSLQGKALCIINMSLEDFSANKYKTKLFNYQDSFNLLLLPTERTCPMVWNVTEIS